MKIATHSGNFHADEVTAVAILKLIYPKAKVIRTRDEKKLNETNIRVDVGRKYNPKTKDFDHHQKSFKLKSKNGVPYASAGIIWKHYGGKLAKSKESFEYIDKKIIQGIDAEDLGINLEDKNNIYHYTISKIIYSFSHDRTNAWIINKNFNEAVRIMVKILSNEITHLINIEKDKKRVLFEIKKSNGDYIVFDPPTPSWKETVIEKSKIKFVIFKYSGGDWWCSFAVLKELDKFENRKLFPKKWADLTNEKLAKVSGVKDALFCHKDRFIVTAKSKEGVIKLTELALKK